MNPLISFAMASALVLVNLSTCPPEPSTSLTARLLLSSQNTCRRERTQSGNSVVVLSNLTFYQTSWRGHACQTRVLGLPHCQIRVLGLPHCGWTEDIQGWTFQGCGNSLSYLSVFFLHILLKLTDRLELSFGISVWIAPTCTNSCLK